MNTVPKKHPRSQDPSPLSSLLGSPADVSQWKSEGEDSAETVRSLFPRQSRNGPEEGGRYHSTASKLSLYANGGTFLILKSPQYMLLNG
jgi:hypothetical protein